MSRTALLTALIMPAFLVLLPENSLASNSTSFIDEKLQDLSALLKEDPSGKKSQNYLRRNSLLYPIQKYLYGVPGTLIEHSHERQQRVLEMEGRLRRYETVILDTTKASFAQGNGETSSVRLLPFFPKSDGIKDALFSIIRETNKNQEFIIQSYEAIFMLQLDDADLRGGLVDFIKKNRFKKTTQSNLAAGLYSSSARWGVPEMQELYLSDIETPIHPDNYINGNNRLSLISNIENAARGLEYYGKMPHAYIDVLEARMRELDLNSGDEQDALSQFKQTIAILRGDREPEFAVSWKGQLLGISNETYRKWFGHDREIKSAEVFDRRPPNYTSSTLPVSPSAMPIQQPKSATSPSPTFETKPTSSSFPILPVAIVVALILGIVLLILRRKSK